MGDTQAAALVNLCASVLENGEVTSEEAYRLAEWLNAHGKAAETWPGNELVEPLQQIWADGEASPRELHRLARILISLQREWAKQALQSAGNRSDESGLEIKYNETSEPRLPAIHKKLEITSRSSASRQYIVDLMGPTCSCPDWRGCRSRLPQGHLSRCCRHVFDAYAQLPIVSLPSWMEAFLELAWPAKPNTDWQLISVGSDLVLYSSADDRGWANCFAKEASTYVRFGYNVFERRWAYGAQPLRGWAIAEAIASLKPVAVSPTSRSRVAAVHEQARTSRQRLSAIVTVTAGVVLLAIATSKIMLRNRSPVAAREWPTSPPLKRPGGVISAAPADTIQPRSNLPWSATAIRPIRVQVGSHEILIPPKQRLRVIGRAGNDLMVSYNNETMTIPVSATDLK